MLLSGASFHGKLELIVGFALVAAHGRRRHERR
jgi:hypothetical protein